MKMNVVRNRSGTGDDTLRGSEFYNPCVTTGVKIVQNSLHIPCYIIAENAGVDGSVVAETVACETGDVGYDAVNDVYVDMLDVGIIDPTKVVRTSLADAASVASLLITAEVVITIKPINEKEDKAKSSYSKDEEDSEEEAERQEHG